MPKKPVTQKQSDVVTNRLMLVITVCFAAFALLIYLNRLLQKLSFASHAETLLNVLIGISAAFVAFATIRLFTAKSRGVDFTVKIFTGYGLLAAALITLFSVFSIRFFAFTAIRMLYIAIPVVCALYIIYHIYHQDFFVLAVWAVLGVSGFWIYYKTMDYTVLQGRHGLVAVVVAVVALLMVILLLAVKRREGVMTFGDHKVQFMPQKGLYFPIYILLGLIVVGTLLVVPYRAVAAYYASLILGAYAFLCAVIYTIRLMYD